jgi:hypothetical protein
VLQSRLPVHIAEAAARTGGRPEPPALANAAALAFGDVYRIAMGAAIVAWLLAWTLRRHPVLTAAPAAAAPGGPATDGAVPVAEPVAEPRDAREPVLIGD